MPSRETHITSLRPFIDSVFDARKDVKVSTKEVWKLAGDSLVAFFGADRKLASIAETDSESFKQHLVGLGLAPSTIHKRLQVSKTVFRLAAKRKIVASNPFDEVSHSPTIPQERKYFVDNTIIETVLNHCDWTWKCIVALSRYGGLRTPSETLSLRWRDIDWTAKTFLVTSPKTEHHPNGATRLPPLFPELASILSKARAELGTPDDDDYIVDGRYRESATNAGLWRNANLRTQFLRIIKRAGLKPWPRLFHNLRASRETELAARFPIHVVSYWLGNTPDIAIRHYLQTTQADYARAVTVDCNEVSNIAEPRTIGNQDSPSDSKHDRLNDDDPNTSSSSNDHPQPSVEKSDAESGAAHVRREKHRFARIDGSG